MLLQTKDVIDRLKAAGLKRKEFSAQCERIVRKGVFVGFGDVQIILWCPMERQRALAQQIAAQGFKVIQYTLKGKDIGGVHVYDTGESRLVKTELQKGQE